MSELKTSMKDNDSGNEPTAERPVYERPTITVMDEEEVLNAFQVTHATLTWWTM